MMKFLKQIILEELRKVLSEQSSYPEKSDYDQIRDELGAESPNQSRSPETQTKFVSKENPREQDWVDTPEFGSKITSSPTRIAIMNLQKAMLKAGADLGNSGPRRDGVDGVVGQKTKDAFNAAINTDQSPDFDEVWSGKHNIMNPRNLKSLTKRFTVNREKYAAIFKKGVSDDASALPKDPLKYNNNAVEKIPYSNAPPLERNPITSEMSLGQIRASCRIETIVS
jgi:hypothetical protein